MYYTFWMLYQAKTERKHSGLCYRITDKLPTGYRHITNCRPTVARLSADRQPIFWAKPVGRLSAGKRPTVGQLLAHRRPTVGRLLADRFFGELFFTITELLSIITKHLFQFAFISCTKDFSPLLCLTIKTKLNMTGLGPIFFPCLVQIPKHKEKSICYIQFLHTSFTGSCKEHQISTKINSYICTSPSTCDLHLTLQT